MLHLLFLLLWLQTGDKCSCPEGSTALSDLANFHTREISICGVLENKNADTFVVSECQIVNCKNGSHISDHSADGIFKVILIKQKDCLLVRETAFLLDSADNIIYAPCSETKITFFDGKMVVSEPNDIFVIPTLTKRQLEALNHICTGLRTEIAKGNTEFPYDEKSIYLLYMGALNGDAEAIYLFKNLASLFNLDGAIAETRGELFLR